MSDSSDLAFDVGTSEMSSGEFGRIAEQMKTQSELRTRSGVAAGGGSSSSDIMPESGEDDDMGNGKAPAHSSSESGGAVEPQPYVNPYDSLEAVPNTMFYRKDARPTIDSLAAGFSERSPSTKGLIKDEEGGAAGADGGEGDSAAAGGSEAKKFGTWDGVFIRVVLNIWGVIMFLRLGWVVGVAGIWLASIVILMSFAVTTFTTLSLSAICTNGIVKGGGAYFMISRSLGAEWGGAIGVLFSLANAVAVALYVVGFAETFVAMVAPWSPTGSPINDIRLYGCIIVTLLLVICLIGVSWEARLQQVLLVLLLLALSAFFIGSFIKNKTKEKAGVVGFGNGVLGENMLASWSAEYTFFDVFGVFFPAATGIMAGANISGDLKDAQKAIPQGTLTAIGVTGASYVGIAWVLASIVTKDALLNNNLVMVNVSLLGAFIYVGIYAATLSSALASLVGAPRVFQALCEDKLFPYIELFGRGYGKDNEPYPAYFLAYGIAVGCILIGELNIIARVISQFFLVSYCLINMACFAATVSKSPGWRPSFSYYHPAVAFAGGMSCLVVMFLIDWVTAFVALVVVVSLYKYLDYAKPEVNWGSALEANQYMRAMKSMYSLLATKKHVKNFRPQYLFLCERLETRPNFVTFLSQLSQNVGALICSTIIVNDFNSESVDMYNTSRAENETYLKDNNIDCFTEAVIAPNFRNGVQSQLMLSGLANMKPNVLIMGFKRDWGTADAAAVEDYVEVMRDAFALRYGVGILRNPEALDFSAPPPTGTIDIWWLFADGGLPPLCMHILTKNPYWKNCTIRILYENEDALHERVRMQALLKKFRIEAEPVILTHTKPAVPTGAGGDRVKNRTENYRRLGTVIATESANASLIVVTYPFPKQQYPAAAFMNWMDILSNFERPTLLLRGNQESVLTGMS